MNFTPQDTFSTTATALIKKTEVLTNCQLVISQIIYSYFVDEINRFIPKSQHLRDFNSVSEEIMKVLIGGRSRGKSLFCQQFKSATDYRFQENIDLHVFGKLGIQASYWVLLLND